MKQDEHRPTLEIRHAIFCIVLAGLAWLGIWWWNYHQTTSPVEKHLEAGLRLFQNGQGAAAESEWLRAIEIDPKNATAWETLGNYYLSTGHWESSLKAYSVVAALNPKAHRLWTKVARAEANIGNAAEAHRHVDVALKSDPDDVEALSLLTTLLQREGESAKRVEVLLHLVKLQPKDVTVLNKTADALMMRRRYKEAAPLVDQLLSLSPNSSSAYAMRGAIVFNNDASTNSLQEATADFQKAVELNKNNWVARWYLGRSFLRLNQPQKAIGELKFVDLMNPSDKSYLNDLATAYQLNGYAKQATATRERFAIAERQMQAIRELRSRLAAAPNDFKTNFQLGLLLLQSKNPDGAEDLLKKALQLKPHDKATQQALLTLDKDYQQNLQRSLLYLNAKNLNHALPLLARVLQLRPQDERTKSAVQQLSVASGVGFYQTVSELEQIAQR